MILPDLPNMTKVRQRFAADRLEDIAGSLDEQFASTPVGIEPRSEIAIAVGSRGIANLQLIVRQTVDWVRACGATPFIVPAMGSHGGATPEGQTRLLAGYGITKDGVGAEIRATMEVVEVAGGEDMPVGVYLDKCAASAAGTIVINRIKPHTDYHGTFESGLMKMTAIGLGKQAQAMEIHGYGVEGLRDVMPQVARHLLRHANVIMGIGIVENAYDETLMVRVLAAADIPDQEPELLDLSRRHMPRLPIEQMDLLIVDQIGKDISGVGLDSNIVGRMRIRELAEPESPDVRVIVIRDLTEASHGNAVGMGLADVCTKRLFDKIDFAVMNENIYTATFLERGKVPIVADTDRDAVAFALRACNGTAPVEAKIVRIRDTLHLDEVLVSDAVVRQLDGAAHINAVGPAGPLFDAAGEMPAL